MSEQVWWFLCRSSGIVAWALLVASLLWGVALAIRTRHDWVRPAWTFALHRWLGTLTVVAIGVHLAALVADSYVTFTVLDLLVPFASDYRPWGVALGVLSLWLVVAVQVSARMRRRLPGAWWHLLHRASYLLVLTVSLHAALTGTDMLQGFYVVATGALVFAPLVALAVRVRRPAHSPGSTSRPLSVPLAR